MEKNGSGFEEGLEVSLAGLIDWLNIKVRNKDVGKTTLGFLPWATGSLDCTGHVTCNQKLEVLPDLSWAFLSSNL